VQLPWNESRSVSLAGDKCQQGLGGTAAQSAWGMPQRGYSDGARAGVIAVVEADHGCLTGNLQSGSFKTGDKVEGDLVIVADHRRAGLETVGDKAAKNPVVAVENITPILRGEPEELLFVKVQSQLDAGLHAAPVSLNAAFAVTFHYGGNAPVPL